MIERLRETINEFFVGKEKVVEDVLVCMLAGGHVLLEDVPGVGKTTLAKTLASVVNMKFGRIQFTPDTLPSDVVGLTIYNMKTGEFEFKEGAVMCQMLLADEINRTSPKTQACLLEAMAESQVSVDGSIYKLPEPFFVIATQNPVEYLGTYPLPEAQMDRFMMKLSIGYPDDDAEKRMMHNYIDEKKPEDISAICSAEDIAALKKEVRRVSVNDAVLSYIQDIIHLTRSDNRFVTGASPRAMLFLVEGARAKAYLEGRDHVQPDDVKAVAINILHHRLTLTQEARIRNEDTDNILKGLLVKARVPVA